MRIRELSSFVGQVPDLVAERVHWAESNVSSELC